MKKTLIAAAILTLALSACADRTTPSAPETAPAASAADAPPPASSSPANPTSLPVLPTKRIAAKVLGVSHVVFSSTQDCVADGYLSAQCDRARSTALAMLSLDPPRYPTQQACWAQFKVCSRWPSGPFAGQFSPPPVGFSMGGEEKGSSGPTPEKPSVYAPVFIDNQGNPVLTINQPTGVQVLPLVSSSQP